MRPDRLHHNAYVAKDLEQTRAFYEDIIGLPLVTTWREGEGDDAYCHVFFELADGSALAFFQFANPTAAEEHLSARPKSNFYHIALNTTADYQATVAAKAQAQGIEPQIMDHGYCTSLYLSDPDGMLVELTVYTAAAQPLIAERRKDPHRELKEWLAGDHTANNEIRHS